MAFNVQEFRAALALDGARPNLFKCDITFPITVNNSQEMFSFMCRAAELPASVVAEVPMSYFGRQLKFAGNRIFGNWTVTIVNDEDFSIRKSFEEWMSAMNSHVANLRDPEFISGDGGYQRDGFVTQFGKAGDIIKRYKFVGMFPTELGPIGLDWGADNTIEEYSVTFAYQWWEAETTDSVGFESDISPILPRIP